MDGSFERCVAHAIPSGRSSNRWLRPAARLGTGVVAQLVESEAHAALDRADWERESVGDLGRTGQLGPLGRADHGARTTRAVDLIAHTRA